MYHCVHAAGDPDCIKNRHPSGTSLDRQRERVDATRARALRKTIIKFLADKELHIAAQRLALEGSRGYPSTDEMQHLAEMLQGKIELVDLEEPASPMTTYGEEGPVLFRIAHQNIAHDPTDTCDHWVLIDLGPSARKEARLRMETLEKLNGKMKPKVSLRNTKAPRPPERGHRMVQLRSRMNQMDVQNSRVRKVAIERQQGRCGAEQTLY